MKQLLHILGDALEQDSTLPARRNSAKAIRSLARCALDRGLHAQNDRQQHSVAFDR